MTLTVKSPFTEKDIQELLREIDKRKYIGIVHTRVSRILDISTSADQKRLELYQLLVDQLPSALYDHLCDISTDGKCIKGDHKDILVNAIITRYTSSPNQQIQKENNMSTKNTPILDLPIIVKGIDIRDTDTDSLIILLGKLNDDQEKYKKLGDSLFAKKALKKIEQARKCVNRELDKKEP